MHLCLCLSHNGKPSLTEAFYTSESFSAALCLSLPRHAFLGFYFVPVCVTYRCFPLEMAFSLGSASLSTAQKNEYGLVLGKKACVAPHTAVLVSEWGFGGKYLLYLHLTVLWLCFMFVGVSQVVEASFKTKIREHNWRHKPTTIISCLLYAHIRIYMRSPQWWWITVMAPHTNCKLYKCVAVLGWDML